MRHRQGSKWVGCLLAVGALTGGCGGSLSQGTQEGELEPGIHWEPAQLRADGGDTALLEVRVEGPSAVCEVALSRVADDAVPTWEPMTLEGGQLTRGGRVSETALPPGPLRLRVRTCDGRESTTDVRHVSEAQRIAATIDI